MEARFEILRKQAGFVLAPIAFFGLYFAKLPGLDTLDAQNAVTGHNHSAHALAAIMATTAVLWICESMPMVVTALLAAAACIIFGVGTPEQVFSPFASYITFLFIGSFILAQAVFVHGLDKRFAYAILAHPLGRRSAESHSLRLRRWRRPSCRPGFPTRRRPP